MFKHPNIFKGSSTVGTIGRVFPHICATGFYILIESYFYTSISFIHRPDIIYFDFAKAFDTVNHYLLLRKLKTHYKIETRLLKFLINYLQNRHQRVVLENVFSDYLPVISGVPQGSILGPLLFVLFINDISSGISTGTNICLFADDPKIWRQMTSNEDCDILQKDINYLYH